MPCKIEEDIGRREIRIAEQRIVDSQRVFSYLTIRMTLKFMENKLEDRRFLYYTHNKEVFMT
jgi:hypothetical protein